MKNITETTLNGLANFVNIITAAQFSRVKNFNIFLDRETDKGLWELEKNKLDHYLEMQKQFSDLLFKSSSNVKPSDELIAFLQMVESEKFFTQKLSSGMPEKQYSESTAPMAITGEAYGADLDSVRDHWENTLLKLGVPESKTATSVTITRIK